MNYWWANQSHSWNEELSASAICASADTIRPKYRKTVGEARRGDIVVHYRSGRGIVAVSHVLADAIVCRANDRRAICLYGEGWACRTKYYVFDEPIPTERFIDELAAATPEDGPVVLVNSRKRVRQAYFMRLSEPGFHIIEKAGAIDDWPRWARSTRRGRQEDSRSSDSIVEATEGLSTEIRMLRRTQSASLRDEALTRASGICSVCEVNYSELLRGAGKHALQVHHKKQLSATDVPVRTKLDDLVVLCATCHSLIHSRPGQPFSVGRLKSLLEKDGYLHRIRQSRP